MSGGPGTPAPDRYLLDRAWVDGAVRESVLVEVAGGRFTRVVPRADGSTEADGATVVPGLSLPGLANCHSHAFHRALRGRTQQGEGTFWTWRDQMYALAETLDPDRYFLLARATYREMAAAGITSVGEFHYLHHQPDGSPYAEPNAMGLALVAAAGEAGIRIALLDTLYLSSGFGAPVEGVQRRYRDAAVEAWADRLHALERDVAARAASGARGAPAAVVGAALHSVRAVPASVLPAAAEAARGRPVHLHLSEQVAENDDCRAAYGLTPTRLLHDHGLLGPATTVVHATHLTEDDIGLLGAVRTNACFCPTTERDLGDGIGPGRALHEAGARLTLGSDSHAVVDLFEEMRALELDERLATRRRGHWPAADLLAAATAHDSLGFADAGRIEVGARADLVTLDVVSPRTAGTGADEHTAVYAAGAADVVQVVVDGRVVAVRDDHEEIGRELAAAIAGARGPAGRSSP